MKTIISIVVAFAVLSGGSAYAAKKLNFTDLPERVQKTIADQKAGNDKGMTIKETTENGQTVYQVTLKQEGKDTKLWIASDGTLIKDNRSGSGKTTQSGYKTEQDFGYKPSFGKAEKMRLGDAPVAVQNTVRAQAGASEIGAINREVKDGKTLYKVEFKREGKNDNIWVTEDGSLIQQDRGTQGGAIKEKSGAEIRTEPTTARAEKQSNLAITDLPKAAQDAVIAQKGDAQTEGIRIVKKEKAGKIFYEVKFKKDGKDTKVKIAEDGAILPEKD